MESDIDIVSLEGERLVAVKLEWGMQPIGADKPTSIAGGCLEGVSDY